MCSDQLEHEAYSARRRWLGVKGPSNYEPPRWARDRPSILAPEHQKKLEAAFQRGIVFGEHMHYYGGSSLDGWAFRDFDRFIEYVHRSRPGDQYAVWSLPDLVAKNFLLAYCNRAPLAAHAPLLSTEDLQTIRAYLDVKYNEFVALFAETSSRELEILYNDEDGYEVIVDYIDDPSFSAVWVFPLTHIDVPEHTYLKAKYPNERDEVPIGGAY